MVVGGQAKSLSVKKKKRRGSNCRPGSHDATPPPLKLCVAQYVNRQTGTPPRPNRVHWDHTITILDTGRRVCLVSASRIFPFLGRLDAMCARTPAFDLTKFVFSFACPAPIFHKCACLQRHVLRAAPVAIVLGVVGESCSKRLENTFRGDEEIARTICRQKPKSPSKHARPFESVVA